MGTYTFNYRIENTQNEVTGIYSFDAQVTDRMMEKVVEAMIANDGFHVELDDVAKLGDEVFDQALMQHGDFLNSDDEFYWEKNNLVLDEKLPDELLADAERMLGYKNMYFDYYYILDGEEHKHSDLCGITNASFNAMVHAVSQLPQGVNAFDFLKTLAPEAYEEIAGIVLVEAAFKYGMREYNKNIHAYLKDFPYQVYENVTL